jgi:carboxylate-amine ligase
VGVEEEFLLLWPRGDVACVAPEVLAAVAAGVGAHAEYNRCQVEAATGVRSGLATVGRELSVARRALAQAAADLGARLVASGTPPAMRRASRPSPTTRATGGWSPRWPGCAGLP